MQTQKDHVHAYAFQAGRMSAALVTGEGASLEAPARRAKLGIIVGMAVSVLILVGFFLFGLIKHQTEEARKPTRTITPTGTAVSRGYPPHATVAVAHGRG